MQLLFLWASCVQSAPSNFNKGGTAFTKQPLPFVSPGSPIHDLVEGQVSQSGFPVPKRKLENPGLIRERQDLQLLGSRLN